MTLRLSERRRTRRSSGLASGVASRRLLASRSTLRWAARIPGRRGKMKVVSCLLAMACLFAASSFSTAYSSEHDDWISRGRYLVKVSGCNECHTEAYARTFGKVPESEWMVGRAWGEMGPWGTTFPTNVRLL